MERAEKEARRSEKDGASKDENYDRTLSTQHRTSSLDRTGMTLPVVEEVGEAGSTGERSGRSGISRERQDIPQHTLDRGKSRESGVRLVLPEPKSPSDHLSPPLGGQPPPTPPKDVGSAHPSEKMLPEIPTQADSMMPLEYDATV